MLSEGKLRTLNDFIEKTSKEELIWINGYISGLISTSMPKDSGAVIQKRFTILYVKVASMDTYKAEDLLQEKAW